MLDGKVAQPQALEMVLTEKEYFPPREGAAKNGGLEAWRQRRNDCESGQRRGDDRWSNGYSFVLDPIFPLPGS